MKLNSKTGWLIRLIAITMPIAVILLTPIATLGQASTYVVHTHCPVQATRISPRVYSFREYQAGEEGWRPISKMALDLRVKNGSDRGIAAMSFVISAPHGTQIEQWDNALLNLKPGDEGTIYYPTDGKLIDLYGGYTSVSVMLTKIRYADGEISDFQCDLGKSLIPPEFKPEKPSTPSQVLPIGGDVSPPRVLESHAMDLHRVPHICTKQEVDSDPTTVCCQPTSFNSCAFSRLTVRLSAVIEIDGTPQQIQVESGSLGEQLDKQAIETLEQWNFAPAMMADKPVATRVIIPFEIDWYGKVKTH
jgi:TonB family protein